VSNASQKLAEALEALDNHVCNNLSRDYPAGIDVNDQPFKDARDALAAFRQEQAQESSELLTDDKIVEVWNNMPGGPTGWLVHFGYTQFARRIEAAVVEAHRLAARPAEASEGKDALVQRGYLMEWPAFGGGRTTTWAPSDAAAKAIGCPYEPVYVLAATQPNKEDTND
jgi:hypothetical protein